MAEVAEAPPAVVELPASAALALVPDEQQRWSKWALLRGALVAVCCTGSCGYTLLCARRRKTLAPRRSLLAEAYALAAAGTVLVSAGAHCFLRFPAVPQWMPLLGGWLPFISYVQSSYPVLWKDTNNASRTASAVQLAPVCFLGGWAAAPVLLLGGRDLFRASQLSYGCVLVGHALAVMGFEAPHALLHAPLASVCTGTAVTLAVSGQSAVDGDAALLALLLRQLLLSAAVAVHTVYGCYGDPSRLDVVSHAAGLVTAPSYLCYRLLRAALELVGCAPCISRAGTSQSPGNTLRGLDADVAADVNGLVTVSAALLYCASLVLHRRGLLPDSACPPLPADAGAAG
eukprot:TRINITY_DN16099_c0_g1_i1.p1 TRINITY_DN16099_c0_g1~~TRINITY_DN16099_c0_g1_i1.p1  ORF type:complete len:359 (+),score=156.17 TRINITY_DN16099_c0_g1_i1:47-1078(+)